MTVTLKDGLFSFGSQETVEVPPELPVSATYGDIKSTNDATQKVPLGMLYRHKGNVYRYVKFYSGAGAVASAAGAPVMWYSLDPANGLFTVTSDFTDSGGTSGSGVNMVAGIALGVVTTGYYTWIQVGGVAMVLVGASTAAGEINVSSGTDNILGRIIKDASVTGVPVAVALEAISTTTASKAYCLLMGMIW